MNQKKNKQYDSPCTRIAPFAWEKSFLTVSATVPGATIDDAVEEEWTVS